MLKPHAETFRSYQGFICTIVTILGSHEPSDTQDRVCRNLLADIHDTLRECSRIIFTGNCPISYPLLRRAFETTSLMALCYLDPKYAEKWWNGAEISNGEVRKELEKHPMGEPSERLRATYKFLSARTHPNRTAIPDRFLGEPNQFTLGSIAVPSLALVVDYLLRCMSIWFWFTALTTFAYRHLIFKHDPQLREVYRAISTHADKIQTQLAGQLDRLYAEEKDQFVYKEG